MNKNDAGFYLIDLKSKESMHLYYGLKGRFEYKVDNREEVIKFIQSSIKDVVDAYDYIVYPESSSSFLADVVKGFDKPTVLVKKRSIESVMEFFETLPLQKKERESHLERLNSMGPTFKINLMKSTQRVKYEQVIFETVALPEGKGLVIDDSHFSGTTYRGLMAATGNLDFLAIFSK
jgi:hypothetical protein